jgi:hypothetical protein
LLTYYDWGVTGSSNVLRTVGAVAPEPRLDTIESETLLPGGEIEGWLAKRVDAGETDLEFVYLAEEPSGWRYVALEEGARLPVQADANSLVGSGPNEQGLSRDAPAKRGETVVIPPYAVEVLEYARGAQALSLLQESGASNLPGPGNEFVLVKVGVTNAGLSEAPLYISDYGLFRLSGSAGIIHDPVLNVLSYIRLLTPTAPLTDLGVWLYPGGTTDGWILFEIREGETDLILSLEPQNRDVARYLALE